MGGPQLWRYSCQQFLLQRQSDLGRQLVVSECEGLRKLLDEHQCLLLARLGELDAEIVRRREENAARLLEETARLSTLIMELEGKCQRWPELVQGVQSTVSRGKEGTPLHPAPKFPELEKRIQDFCEENKLQEAVIAFLVDVTLDPNTAHPNLVLSQDRKRVRHRDTPQDLPDTPERFDRRFRVLGCEGFTSGRHYWEVEVGDKTAWALGVCRESVDRKGEKSLSPGNGYWALCLSGRGYEACTSPLTPLHMCVCPRRMGVFLDYGAGEVSFYNVTDRSHLFTLTHTFFEILCPFFSPGFNAEGTNAAPLILWPVPGLREAQSLP
ncbi:hypothetical protein Y1Q_0016933 [Alligator mississippiensis]|uniref:B30.2/SPRY domain-containing protein n=1 Tax=Alligator mississippiensis TaxID=8496 RepID=A0A151M1E1_ALLMI|nr:hypothetical protein Y1Q_0016933 [Alligator mississippiensis]